MSSDTLPMWTIYDHPTDFPDGFVARKWEIRVGECVPTDEVMLAPLLEELRDRLALHSPGLVCLPPQPNDDPKIVETWL